MKNQKTIKKSIKNVLFAKVKPIDITDGEELEIVINEKDALLYGITSHDKVSVVYSGGEIVLNASLTNSVVTQKTVWLMKDVTDKYGIKDGEMVEIFFTKSSSLAVESIKKKLLGKKLNYKEMYAIIDDIAKNKLSDTMITYYVSSSYFYKTTDEELYLTAKAMAETGKTIKFPGIVVDKHCIGGVPGNETTMIVVPIITSLGYTMPKTFSKAITSPAATGECVELLMNISFTENQIKNIVKKHWWGLFWWWGLALAPADDRIIKVSYPLSMQSYSKMISSIMAKKYAMGVTHCLIDIPMGPTAKVTNKKDANMLVKKFEFVGKKLGMKMNIQITDARQPVGSWIGTGLQVREVLRILQQHSNRPKDLELKAIKLASEIIKMTGMAKGKKAEEIAWKQLRSWTARKKFQEIMKAQWGKNLTIKSEEIELGKEAYELKTNKNWVVKQIDMKILNNIARTLGCPFDNKAGVYLNQKLNAKVKKWDTLCTLYSSDSNKLKMALEMLKTDSIYEVK